MRTDAVERFWAKVDQCPHDECWEWHGAMYWDGYGAVTLHIDGHRTTRRAHRIAYELLIGPIPDGLDLDHLCRNRACVNPTHLEPVSRRENTLRGETLPARYVARTHCANGHEYTSENTRYNGNARACRACDAAYHRALRRQKREAQRCLA